MTITEIIKLQNSRRFFFKRPNHKFWLWMDSLHIFEMYDADLDSDKYRNYDFYIEDLIADDWIVKPREWMLKSDNFGKLVVYNGPDLKPGEIITIREVLK